MKNKKSKKNPYLFLIIFMFFLMILDAIAEIIKGIFVPIFKTSFNINDRVIGAWFFIGSLGYIIFTYLGGLISKKFGQKKVFMLGIIMAIISCILFSLTNNVSLLFLDVFLINGALALCAIAINTLVPVIALSFQAILMNLTHFFYGLGTTIGTSVTGYLLHKNISWKMIYLGVGIIYILVAFVTLFIKIPEVNLAKKEKKHNTNILKNKLVYFYGIALGFYVFAEGGSLSWLVNYIQKSYSLSISNATKYLSIFTAVFTIGRLLGGFIVEKVGQINSIIYSTCIAIILLLIGIISGENGLGFIAVSGMFFSITFPTMVLSISNVFKEDASYITGIIVSSASIVNMVFNAVLGNLNEFIGARYAFFIIPFSLFISLCFQISIKKVTKNNI